MGGMVRYQCPKCGYEINALAGAGMMGIEYDWFVCHECAELCNVEVYDHIRERKILPRCSESKSHHIEKWSAPGPCPKCGATIEEGEGFGCWD